MKEVNILGTNYKIIDNVNPEKMPNMAGQTHFYTKEIWVVDFDKTENKYDKNLYKETLRHEVLHSFLFESGLNDNSLQCVNSWARNEEMIDWFAIQAPKIYKVYRELNIL